MISFCGDVALPREKGWKGMSGSNLGRSLSLHRGMFSAGGWLWYVGAILLAAGVVNVAQAVGILDTKPGTPSGSLGLGAGAFAAGLLILIAPVLRWRQQVELFEGGFVWSRLTGTASVRRDEVQSVEHITHHSRSGTHTEVVVHLKSGRELSMSGLSQSDQLANMMSAYASAPAMGAQAIAAPTGWTPPVL